MKAVQKLAAEHGLPVRETAEDFEDLHVVLDEDDGELDTLLKGRHEFPGEHQVGAVSDQHEDLAFRCGELHSEPAGDLVAHAGVAVLEVVAA